jgi:hypothetical protein
VILVRTRAWVPSRELGGSSSGTYVRRHLHRLRDTTLEPSLHRLGVYVGGLADLHDANVGSGHRSS